MTNRPTLDQLLDDPKQAEKLPLDVIALLMEDSKTQAAKCTAANKIIVAALEARFADKISAKYHDEAKDTGTIHLVEGDFDIEVTRPKKVEWSQAELQRIGDEIAAQGDDPREYIETTYNVQEKKFTAWPKAIQKVFETARTLKTGSTAIKLSQKEHA